MSPIDDHASGSLTSHSNVASAHNTESGAGGELIVNGLPLTDAEREEFTRAAPGMHQEFVTPESQRAAMMWDPHIPEALIAHATAVIGNAPAQQIHRCQRLRWLQTSSAGADTYLRGNVLPAGAKLTTASGAYGQSVSEHMFALMWALMKQLPRYRDQQTRHEWRDAGSALSPRGANVLVIGTGDIGSHFATLCKAVGSRTVGVRRNAAKPADGIDGMHGFDELDALLPDADVVAMSVPSTPQTRHLLDMRRLELLPPQAIVLNVGRGDAIDNDALADALARGIIRGAGLDVTEPEPLPAGHPLWDEPRCLITPHAAGGTHVAATGDRVVAIALDNLRRYAQGRSLRNLMTRNS